MKNRMNKGIAMLALMMSLICIAGAACAGNEIEYIPTWMMVEDGFITIEGYFRNNLNREVSDFEDFTLYLLQDDEAVYACEVGDLDRFDIQPHDVMEYFFIMEGEHDLNHGEYFCVENAITADCSFTYYY